MAKKSRPTVAPADAAKPTKDRGGARKELKRLERNLADLIATEAKHRKQLEEVRAMAADARSRLIALRTEVTAAGRAAGADGSVAGPVGYCMREKRSVEISHPEPVTLSNGRTAIAGTCPTCGARVMAFSARPKTAGQ
jgi:hypothetical protein